MVVGIGGIEPLPPLLGVSIITFGPFLDTRSALDRWALLDTGIGYATHGIRVPILKRPLLVALSISPGHLSGISFVFETGRPWVLILPFLGLFKRKPKQPPFLPFLPADCQPGLFHCKLTRRTDFGGNYSFTKPIYEYLCPYEILISKVAPSLSRC